MMETAVESLVARVRQGDVRALARVISLIEDESPLAPALVAALYPHASHALLLGVTGPPGAGKSTLVDRLTSELRADGKTVGVVAVDPSSPYSGGAMLGDRVRMQAHAADSGVFIRSMATRGHLGGLARATGDVVIALDAAGRDVVLVETVGVGQDEVDIVRTADVSIVVLVPGAGDEVQALKAGIMEIADLFVVNKADREGADRTAASIESLLALQTFAPDAWRPPIIRTEATTGRGVRDVLDAVARFREHPASRLPERRRARTEFRLRDVLATLFMSRVGEAIGPAEFDSWLDRIGARDTDPYTAATSIAARVLSTDAAGQITPGVVTSEVDGWRAGASAFPEAGAAKSLPAAFADREPAAILDHIGIAVGDIDAALAFYRDALGLDVAAPEAVPTERLRAHFVPVGEANLELLEATDSESVIARFLARRGPGIHHITLRVPDLQAALDRLKARGVRLIDETPRPGAHGTRVAFVHPSAADGVLIELKEVQG
jgi:LAO/AO transport system kinase